jgi:serine/threonine-protein kinase
VPDPTPSNLTIGSAWQWSDGSMMVYVPAGKFWMGSVRGEDSERPQHEVYLDAFWIDRTEVSNSQYKRCVDNGKCSSPARLGSVTWDRYYGYPEFDGYPVISVSWHQADAYCRWAGKRLPTEAEWEKSARGTDKRIYPWGNVFDGTLLNFCDVNCPCDKCGYKDTSWNDGYAETAPVESYPEGASPYGALNMVGNVWEWTSSLSGSYPYNAEDGREDPAADGERVVRGGYWSISQWGVRTAYRGHFVPSLPLQFMGFRCARSASGS